MKILVIGGSYFLGRVFTMLAAAQNEVTVVNRGTYSMEEFGAACIRADRHDREAMRRIGEMDFDVIVDFCAYQEGDIAGILTQFKRMPKQYIFISTADVYQKWTGQKLTEASPMETRRFGGENGEYIWQKLLLEKELVATCKKYGVTYTSVRPAILYGPFNYAMREAYYVQLACTGHEILCPTGAQGRFQPVYVKDAAAMLLSLCGSPAAFDSAFNLAGEAVDYEAFLDAFVNASAGQAKLKKLPAENEAFGAPDAFLPFPFLKEETEFYDGAKICRTTGLSWIPLEEGLKKTWQVFSRLYT